MLSLYTILDTPGTIERQTGFEEAGPGAEIRGRAGAGGNGLAAAPAEILMNNGNQCGKRLDSLIGLALGLNRM